MDMQEAGALVGIGCLSIFLDDLFYFVYAIWNEKRGKVGKYPHRMRTRVFRHLPKFFKKEHGTDA